MLPKTKLLFLIILIEGYVVLACELLAIRQLIPFVGSGTETISIVISAVLLPLAVGYHWGGNAFRRGYARSKRSGRKVLSVRKILLKNILSALAILTLGLSYVFMEIFFGVMSAAGITHRLAQTTVYAALFLVMPVFLLGQTVPLVSNYFSRRRLSEITGKMLFFSTTGSFLGSVFSTIVLMTFIGVHTTVIVTLGLLTLLALVLAGWRARFEPIFCVLIFGLLYLMNSGAMMSALHIVSNNAYNMISVRSLKNEDAKIMFINRSASSKFAADPKNNAEYIRYIEDNFIARIGDWEMPPRDILILGAGGFTLGYRDMHNRYVYVDIDKALKDVSEKHFLPGEISANKTFIPESARAFVHRDQQQYDLILIDVYTNTISIPMEATTRDFLLDVKKRLKPDGVLISNVISSAAFRDKFTVRYDNTFAGVFPAFARQIIGPFAAWPGIKLPNDRQLLQNNVLYIYFNGALVDDDVAYTDDKNTYSLDRP